MREELDVVAGRAAGSRLTVADELVIGRAAEDDGRLGDDDEISRRHARIARGVDGRLVITDLGSTNGTWERRGRDRAEDARARRRGPSWADHARGALRRDRERWGPSGPRERSRRTAAALRATARGRPAAHDQQPASRTVLGPGETVVEAQDGPSGEVLHAGRRLPVGQDGLSIGRHPDNDLQIGSDTDTVSRQHAEVRPAGGAGVLAGFLAAFLLVVAVMLARRH